MAEKNKIEVIIDILGNATEKLSQIQKQTDITQNRFDKLGEKMLCLNAIMDVVFLSPINFRILKTQNFNKNKSSVCNK